MGFSEVPLQSEGDSRLTASEVPVELMSTLEPMTAFLTHLDFDKFILQRQIKGFQDMVLDGATYHLEIFQSGRYKLLTYHCPETYYSREENNRRFVDVLMALDKNFTFYSPMCKRG